MTAARPQIIGLCRFSYPATGGFQVRHDSLEARCAYLYSDARMEERFRHFECISLPGIRAQTDPDFLFAILVGDNLPEAHLSRLLDLTADVPQAAVIPWAPGGRHRPTMAAVMNALRDDDAPCLQFRHDDDDAVAVDFVERLRESAADCAGLVARHPVVAFDFNRGHVARPGAHGLSAMEIMNPYWGVALGMSFAASETRSIFSFSHYKIPGAMPTVTRTEADMFLRGHNDHNDSRQKPNVKPEPLEPLDSTGEAHFRARYAVDADHVRQVFAGG